MRGDLKFRILNRAHRFVLRASRGRLGWRLLGMEVVALTTTGRRSGEPRTVMLTSPVQPGDAVVVVASRGGDEKHPAWFLNLRDDPRVQVSRRGRPPVPMTARIADPEEHERVWPQVVARYRPYQSYQRHAGREIPLVFLEPRGAGAAQAGGTPTAN